MLEPALSPVALATVPTDDQVPVAGGRSRAFGRVAAAFSAPGAGGHRCRGRLLATPGRFPLFDLGLLRGCGGWGWRPFLGLICILLGILSIRLMVTPRLRRNRSFLRGIVAVLIVLIALIILIVLL